MTKTSSAGKSGKRGMAGRDFVRESGADVLRCMRKIDTEDPSYPVPFQTFPRMPRSFYVIGALPDPQKKTVAIVGARRCSAYGRAEAIRFGRSFAEHGVQVVSGMAYGVDAWAQHGALEGGGKTFAVLGTGADVCYPKENYALYRRIIREGGGIISEFEPGAEPAAWHFPIRNRLISAFADVVLVVEAKLRSGSLITVDYAIEQGKTIYAVPGRNGDALSQGCNRLIAQGAGIAWEPEVVLEELGVIPEAKLSFASAGNTVSDGRAGPLGFGVEKHKTYVAPKEKKLPEKWAHADDFQKVFGHLGTDPMSLDRLQEASGLDLASLSSVLVQLCISGYAEEVIAGYYIRR